MSSGGPLFVTGATGFIGQHLVAELVRNREPVRALVREGHGAAAGAETVRGDLEQIDALAPSLAGCRAVLHTAALLDPIADAAAAQRVNVEGTLALARAAQRAGVGCFVHLSSVAAIGIRDLPQLVGPSTPCRPATGSSYALSKRAAEVALLALERSPMRIVILRPPTVYGVGERRNFLALTRAVASGLFVVPGRGTNRISFCHVRNLTSAMRLVVDEPYAEGLLHVADEPALTLRELTSLLGEALGRPPLPLPFPWPAAWLVALALELGCRPLGLAPPLSRSRLRTLTANFVLDSAALRALGWRPPVAAAAGVAETVEWYRREHLVP